jgi:hypothetical protein
MNKAKKIPVPKLKFPKIFQLVENWAGNISSKEWDKTKQYVAKGDNLISRMS